MTGVFPGIDESRPRPTWIDQPAAAPSRRALSRSSKLVLGLVLVAAVALGALKPVGVFGVDADTMSSSLSGALGNDFGEADCRQSNQWDYRCRLDAGAVAGQPVDYEVGSGQSGCWSARRVTDGRPGAPRYVSGCVGLGDILGTLP